MKPIILITHKFEPETSGFGIGKMYGLRSNYCRAVIRAGGVPLITAMGDADAYAEIADGVIFSGGVSDIDPIRYRDTNRKAAFCDFDLDEMELRLFEAFYKRKKPILGICRGIQLVNVALGGTLVQDVEDEYSNLTVHKAVYEKKTAEHPVKAVPGSLFCNLFGEEFVTNSYHHEAVKECGKGLRPVVMTEEGVIEAIEHESLPIFAAQWHPERMIGEEQLHITNMMPLFEHFIGCCKK